MYDLMTVFQECKDKLDTLSVPYYQGVTISVNHRAHTRLGQARKKGNKYSININADLLNEKNSVNLLKDVIFHELIHTCPGCMNHGKLWQGWVQIVNEYLGANIVVKTEEKEIAFYTKPAEHYKYKIHCPACGAEWKFQRASKSVKQYKHYKCGCGCKDLQLEIL